MKKIFLLPLLALVAMMVSCSDDNDNNMPKVDTRVFTGKLLINGTPVTDGTKCELNVIDGTASVTVYGVQFAPAMPSVDMTMPMLDCKKSADGYEISGSNVLPMVAGTPMMDFLMSAVAASLSGDKFVLTAHTSLGTVGFSNAMLTPVVPVDGAKSYKGELTVGEFSKEVVIDIKENKAAGTVDVVLNDVKFAANMPLELDITLKELPYQTGDNGISFLAGNVAPYINTETEPAPAYMFAVAEGSVADGKLLFNAKMADGLAPYVAGKEFVFEGSEIVE